MHTSIFSAFSHYMWLIHIVLVALVLIVANYGFKKASNFVYKTHPRKHPELWHQFFSTPVKCLLWIVGASLALNITASHFHFSAVPYLLEPVKKALLVMNVTWILLRLKKSLLVKIHQKDPNIRGALDRVMAIVIVVIAGMLVLPIFGLSIAPLIAFGGVGAAAVGFAAKDVIGNFFGGMVLFMTKPIVIGDHILVPDKKIEGDVEEIGWYFTCIRDKEKRPIYLPNAVFTSSFLINATRMTHRRLEQFITVNLAKAEHLEALLGSIRSCLKNEKNIDQELAINVHTVKFDQGCLELRIVAYCLLTNEAEFLTFQHEFLQKVQKMLEESGIVLSLPYLEVALTKNL